MSVLLAICLLIVVLAIFGGLAVSPLLWVLLLIALVVFLFGRGRVGGGGL